MRRWWVAGFCLWLGVLSVGAVRAADPETRVASGRVKVVEDFMSLMVERQLVNQAQKNKLAEIDRKMLDLLAPYYFTVLGIDPKVVAINKYCPDGFRVVLEQGDYVGVKLLRKTQNWPTFIVFKTAEYNGRVVIEPSAVNLAGKDDPSLVTPWFYSAEQQDITAETLPLPALSRPTRNPVAPASAERTRTEGVELVNRLLTYLGGRERMKEEERRAHFVREILPRLARGYTDLLGVDLNYYQEIGIDRIKNFRVEATTDCYVVLACEGCLYDRYYFKIVIEDGVAKILPTGIDNVGRAIFPVWLRE